MQFLWEEEIEYQRKSIKSQLNIEPKTIYLPFRTRNVCVCVCRVSFCCDHRPAIFISTIRGIVALVNIFFGAMLHLHNNIMLLQCSLLDNSVFRSVFIVQLIQNENTIFYARKPPLCVQNAISSIKRSSCLFAHCVSCIHCIRL